MAREWFTNVLLRQGDLTEAATDAVVNAANTELQLGGGVAGFIRARGGPSIQKECDGIGPIPLGGAAVTGGGRLKARHVIHAASMRLGGRATEAGVRDATRNSLLLAAEHRFKAVAFPAIGSGIAGFPMESCARVMLEEIRAHLLTPTSLERVEIVLFDRQALGVFEQTFAEMRTSQG